jgi:hypothetical protein
MIRMLEKLKTDPKTVGMRTTIRAIENGEAVYAFLADDADVFITRRVQELCQDPDDEGAGGGLRRAGAHGVRGHQTTRLNHRCTLPGLRKRIYSKFDS